ETEVLHFVKHIDAQLLNNFERHLLKEKELVVVQPDSGYVQCAVSDTQDGDRPPVKNARCQIVVNKDFRQNRPHDICRCAAHEQQKSEGERLFVRFCITEQAAKGPMWRKGFGCVPFVQDVMPPLATSASNC